MGWGEVVQHGGAGLGLWRQGLPTALCLLGEGGGLQLAGARGVRKSPWPPQAPPPSLGLPAEEGESPNFEG